MARLFRAFPLRPQPLRVRYAVAAQPRVGRVFMQRNFMRRQPLRHVLVRVPVTTEAVVTVLERPPNGLLFGRRPQVQPLYDHALMLQASPAGAFVRGLQRTRQRVERSGRT